MYNKALSLYFINPFEQFPTFSSEYQRNFSLMLTLHDINVLDVITFTFSVRMWGENSTTLEQQSRLPNVLVNECGCVKKG